MIIVQGQLASVVSIEPASVPDRNVIQWDKEDCSDMGLIKVDLLGLGHALVAQSHLANLVVALLERSARRLQWPVLHISPVI